MADEKTTRFLNEVRAFAREHVQTDAAAWARGMAVSPEVALRAAEVGLTRVEVPVEAGGLGLGFRAKAEACAIIAAADLGLAMSLVNTHNVAKRIASTAPKAVSKRLLPDLLAGRMSACTALTEPGTGSDAAAMHSLARKTQGGWLLDGEKIWIVNGRHAGLSIVYAQCAEPGQASGIAAFLVDLSGAGCLRYPIESGFSQVSIGTGGFRLSECFVPDHHLLLPAGPAFKAILEEINGARIYVAAMCCAMVSACLQIAQHYGETRQSFGKPLNQHPTWREPLAECATKLVAAWALVETAILAIENGTETRHVAAAAKVNAVKLAQSELPVLLHAMGAEGLRETYPFTRHIGAAQIAALTDGSTAMLLDRLGRWNPTPIEL
jgi:alkylation response protein AidB-like acyl-CoA dehydrogenase